MLPAGAPMRTDYPSPSRILPHHLQRVLSPPGRQSPAPGGLRPKPATTPSGASRTSVTASGAGQDRTGSGALCRRPGAARGPKTPGGPYGFLPISVTSLWKSGRCRSGSNSLSFCMVVKIARFLK